MIRSSSSGTLCENRFRPLLWISDAAFQGRPRAVPTNAGQIFFASLFTFTPADAM